MTNPAMNAPPYPPRPPPAPMPLGLAAVLQAQAAALYHLNRGLSGSDIALIILCTLCAIFGLASYWKKKQASRQAQENLVGKAYDSGLSDKASGKSARAVSNAKSFREESPGALFEAEEGV